MGGYRAFLAEDSNNYQYELTYYHNPNRWRNNIINTENPIRNVDNWSDEIKYLNESNDDLSDDIKNLPNDTGGIYVGEFYQFNLSSCIRQQNSLTAQFVSFSLSNLANIFYPPQFLQ